MVCWAGHVVRARLQGRENGPWTEVAVKIVKPGVLEVGEAAWPLLLLLLLPGLCFTRSR